MSCICVRILIRKSLDGGLKVQISTMGRRHKLPPIGSPGSP